MPALCPETSSEHGAKRDGKSTLRSSCSGCRRQMPNIANRAAIRLGHVRRSVAVASRREVPPPEALAFHGCRFSEFLDTHQGDLRHSICAQQQWPHHGALVDHLDGISPEVGPDAFVVGHRISCRQTRGIVLMVWFARGLALCNSICRTHWRSGTERMASHRVRSLEILSSIFSAMQIKLTSNWSPQTQ